MCSVVLGWARSSFGFFCTILQKNPNEIFGQPNTSRVGRWGLRLGEESGGAERGETGNNRESRMWGRLVIPGRRKSAHMQQDYRALRKA